ncbi:ferritin family protein [Synechococcus sp. CCY 9618]|uniref:ferritin family protein n=1 Tax=Synechococcus sp. CCY 9618 TaxID=2815602 RepID=UPI0020B343FC|nr:ferritin family protein [Synechococcus sp. CCY 9618]
MADPVSPGAPGLSPAPPAAPHLHENLLTPRSCVTQFSACLLFKELSRQLEQAGRPELGRLFQLMAPDQASHAGSLHRVLAIRPHRSPSQGVTGAQLRPPVRCHRALVPG